MFMFYGRVGFSEIYYSVSFQSGWSTIIKAAADLQIFHSHSKSAAADPEKKIVKVPRKKADYYNM